jgi:hypothetical protein
MAGLSWTFKSSPTRGDSTRPPFLWCGRSVAIMASGSSHLYRFVFCALCLALGFHSGWFLLTAFAQDATPQASVPSERANSNGPYRRDDLHSNWNQRGRTVPGASAAALRLRAYRQKMEMRAQRAGAMRSESSPNTGSSAAFWTPLGPAPLASDATGEGMQDYNWVSGRATSVLIDPADTTGNTVLLGGAYGGLWKSTNAGSLSSNPASVTWQALIDDQPTLAVGAIALQPSNGNVILVGTGETNSSGDSYYGLGILRSTDGGSTWAQIQSAASGQSFQGVGFSKIAFSTANPSLVVAATAGDNGLYVGLEQDANSTARGLYFSTDGGASWNRVILSDAAVPASATGVIYNANQGATGTFYAFIRRHGLYSSTDGQHFTRLTLQPTPGLASASCPAGSNANTCLIYRGEFAVVPGRNEMYGWIVDVQPDSNGNPVPVDEGIWQSLNGGGSWTQIPDNGITNCGDSAFGAGNSGCGVEQGYYNLALAAIPDGGATDVYAGAINLYKCTLAGGTTCTQGDWINLTHVYGCNPGPLGEPAHVHPDQHGIAFTVASGKSPGYFAHDGGISRTLDGYDGLTSGSCTGSNQFDSISESLGSMTEFVSVSVHPTNADILLGGTQDNGSPQTNTATSSSAWKNALGGDGGFNAINPANPSEWFASNPYLNILKCEAGTSCDDADFFEVVSPSNLGGDEGAFYTPYILDPHNPAEMLVGTCRMWRVSTSGAAPLQLSNDFDTLGTGVCTGAETNLVTAVAAGGQPVSGNSPVVYAVTNGYGPLSGDLGGEVWFTTNAGVSLMTNVTGNINPDGYAIAAVAIDNSDTSGKTAYVGIMGFSTPSYPTSHVWKTTNAGASWVDWTGGTGSTGLPDAPVNALLVDSSVTPQIYAGTDVGVFVGSTVTPNWSEAGPSPASGGTGFLPNAPVSALQVFNNNAGTRNLVASTYGRGIWSLPLSANYTNVISNSPQTVFPTQTAVFNGTLTSEVGYSNPVNLSCSGTTPATCTTPAQATPTASYTVAAGGSIGDYTFSAHAVGTDPHAISHDAPVILHVVDFNLTAPSPNSLSVGQGETSQPITFTVSAAGSFDGLVTLNCAAGLPSGANCLFSPSSSVSPTASQPVTVSLTVTAALGTPVGGPVTVSISATTPGAPAAKTQTFTLTVKVPAPDFIIAVTPIPATTGVNQNVTWNGTVTAMDGYSSSVSLSCSSGAPATCTVTPSQLTPTNTGAPFTVTMGSATAGIFNFTIQATDGTLTHTTPTETLTVTAASGSFSWTDTGNTAVTVLAGQSASYTFSAAPTGGATFSSAVNFGCTGLPALTSCAFNPSAIAAGAPSTNVTLTISSTGPNFGTQSRPRRASIQSAAPRRARTRSSASASVLALFSLPWAMMIGMVSTRRIRRGKPKFYGAVFAVCLSLGLMAQLSCGGLAGSSTPPPPVTVTVNPGLATLFEDETGNSWPAGACQQQFTATVNATTNQSVTWAVSGGGTIDATGLYTAPATVPNQSTATVTATSSLAAAPGSAFVTIAPASNLGTSQITVTATAVGGTVHSDIVTLIVL